MGFRLGHKPKEQKKTNHKPKPPPKTGTKPKTKNVFLGGLELVFFRFGFGASFFLVFGFGSGFESIPTIQTQRPKKNGHQTQTQKKPKRNRLNFN
jgi:hypothetical protein